MNIDDSKHSFVPDGDNISNWKCIECGITFYMSPNRPCTPNVNYNYPDIKIIRSSIIIKDKE